MNIGLYQLSLFILFSSVLGIILRFLKQPLILAYLLTGIIFSYFNFFDSLSNEVFKVFSDLGIMFLLFLIGLEINYDSLRMVGRPAIVLGLGQIIFTFIIGFLISQLFNFSILTSFYVSIALTFSSTIIVVKLLSEKKDISSFYGKLSVGFLLVQDFVAILILIFLGGLSSGSQGNILIGKTVLTILLGIIIFSLILYLSRKVLPYIFDRVSQSQELLFLISLGWLFLIFIIIQKLGFSIEIAGFLAGLGLANSAENFQIASKFKSLRDFFIMIFFIILGSSFSFSFSNLSIIGWQIFIFSLFVLIGNPLIVLILMGLMGYRKRTSFMTGVTVAQISEFSLILALMGLKLGHLSDEIVGLITGVGIITITLSTYLILNSDLIFKKISKYLSIFERKKILENGDFDYENKKSIILIGCHRTGQSILDSMNLKDLLVIDFDPDIINFLRKKNVDYIFGDIADDEILEKANFASAKLIISTSPDFNDNMLLLEKVLKLNPRPKIILRAETEKDALILYQKGADYVILPNLTAGQYLGKTIAIDPEVKILNQLKQKDLELLNKKFKI
ncbi:MAG: cation:proton antiporter [Patescibacteria group bacterium]|nr:cation:proton antiporter [Patescibacteria group bacterium]